MPQISVIVPVYKVEQYLPACVESILGQSLSDFELILVDDGSPDNCGALCDAYAAQDPRIRVIHQPNGGLSAARNAGMEIAQGKYMTFIDSDDYVTPDYLELLYRNVEQSGAELAVCRTRVFEDGRDPAADPSAAEVDSKVLTGREAVILLYRGDETVPIIACAKLFRRELLADLRFPVGKLHEDQAFVPIACWRAKTLVTVNARAYYYRDRPESITSKKFSVKRYDDIWGVDQCQAFFRQKGETEILRAAEDKRKRLLCVYAIYAKRDGVSVPEEYRVGTGKALRYLRSRVSADKYQYYLAQIHPKLVRPDAILRKLSSFLGRGEAKHE